MTPKNYLDFINNYKRALATNRSTIQDTVGRLSGGLEKLIQAAVEVDAMQKELSQAKVVVEQATKECNELLEVCRGRGADATAWCWPACQSFVAPPAGPLQPPNPLQAMPSCHNSC